ncbi:MAG: PQQ-binding-like beta-propeller repeat protein [Planctomycetes bacterium]|nr:PQQ-binding-like beta-propeller repeat protein [Planctomycetota bacterium]
MFHLVDTVRASLGRRVACAFVCATLLISPARAGEREPAKAVASEKPGQRNWSMFRGGPQLRGIAHTRLPDRLKVRWKFEAPDAVTSSAAIVNGTVYVGCYDGTLFALHLSDGSVKWKYKAQEAIESSPTVIDGTVYVGDDEGVLHAVDAGSGKGKWTFPTDDQIISSVNHADDRLVFGSYDGFVYCVSRQVGKLLWKFETQGRVHGTPGITAGHVIAAGCDEFIHVLRLDDGRPVRKISMGSVSGASAATHGHRAYVGTYGGHMLGIDWKAGRVEWSFADGDREFPIMSSAAVTDRWVIVGGRDKRVRALDRITGKPQWVFVTNGRVDSSPVVVGDRVFIGSSDGNLYALTLDTGKETWRFEAGGPISASPAVAEGSLVIGTEDGMIYCFGAAK